MSNKIIKWSVFIGSFYKILVEEEKEGQDIGQLVEKGKFT
jgi:hypothetical protein